MVNSNSQNLSDNLEVKKSTRTSRWLLVSIYALICASSQTLWLTFAPITTSSAAKYHVSINLIGWLSEIFPLAYFLFAIPAGKALDRWFIPSLVTGGFINATGSIVRFIYPSYYFLLTGQTLISISQPLLLNAITRVSNDYLDTADQPNGLAVGSSSLFFGMLLALLFGSIFGVKELQLLMVIEGVVSTFLAFTLLIASKRIHPIKIGSSSESAKVISLLRNKRFIALLLVAAVGFGAFIAITTWLQSILSHRGISSSSAGFLLALMVVAGTLGAALLPSIVTKHKLQTHQMYATTVLATLGCFTIAVVNSLTITAVVLGVEGFFLIGALPTILDAADKTNRGNEGLASGLVWLSGNGGGLAISLGVQQLINSPFASFLLLAIIAAFTILLVPYLRFNSV